jgi:molecular chaperone GrpE (heat shock protein)
VLSFGHRKPIDISITGGIIVRFDFFHVNKRIKSLIELTAENQGAIKALSQQVAEQYTQMRRAQKELSLQMEELYDCVSDLKPVGESEPKLLVCALIALRDNIEHLREYSLARNDEDLKHQMELFIPLCDKKLSEVGVRRIEREGKPYDCAMDMAVDVAYTPDMEPNAIATVLSGCYTYCGEIVKRAEVILCKGETHV